MKMRPVIVEIWERDPRDPENQSPYSEPTLIGREPVFTRAFRNPEKRKRAAINNLKRNQPQYAQYDLKAIVEEAPPRFDPSTTPDSHQQDFTPKRSTK